MKNAAPIAFNYSPILENELIRGEPLMASDFEKLYSVASDPLLWEQHPNRDRYKREVFEIFFKGALESNGAFIVYNSKTNEPIGSSRFYGMSKENSSIAIGYTFIRRDHWGSLYNHSLKKLMFQHAFKFVDHVIFHIGASNIRSQRSIEKLGAKKIDEVMMEYYGEPEKLNFVYRISKTDII